MIRRSEEKKTERIEHKFGADGFITVRNLIENDDELNGKGAKVVLSNSDPKNIDPDDNFFDDLYKNYTNIK